MTTDDEPPERVEDFEQLLEYIRQHRGFDFTGYKRSSLQRRVLKRMHERGIENYDAYQDELEVSPDEFDQLFNTILINVSSFLRDPPVWAYVAERLIPQVLERSQSDEPIRAWSAGCATGEEAYTIAMLLADALDEDQFRERVKVFATDVDEDALEQARQARYPRAQLELIPAHLRDRYLEGRGDRLSVVKDLRRAVIFGRNDLVRDAPISRIDLLTCRNTLIYFNTETQQGIMDRLHMALADSGFLVLGKSELIVGHTNGFSSEELGLRIFRKVPGVRLTPARALQGAGPNNGPTTHRGSQTAVIDAFKVSPIAQLVLDSDDAVVFSSEPLRAMFGLTDQDIGRPLKDLEISYRPVELRSLIERAGSAEEPVKSEPITWQGRDGRERELEVQIAALRTDGTRSGTSIAFLDVTRHARVAKELASSKQELERAYEDLRSTVEELETTNEELQSTNEELETTNEELQSTNEELETMNEELQSTNEELETMNEELRLRTNELNQVNTLVESMLESLRLGVAVLDHDLRVTMWNEHAKKLWGLDVYEARDQRFVDLRIGLPVGELQDALRACLTGSSDGYDEQLEARDRSGRDIVCRVQCAPLQDAGSRVTGVIVLMQVLTLSPS